MDSLSDIIQDLIPQWTPTLTVNYITISSLAFTSYDYLLTFPMELSEIWRGRVTSTKILFLLNRYSFLMFEVLFTLVGTLKTDDKGCNDLNYLYGSFVILPQIALIFIFSLRTFAIYQRNWMILILLLLTGSGIIVTLIWFVVTTTASAFPPPTQIGPFACITQNSGSIAQWGLANAILNTVFDTLIFLLTFAKTVRMVLQARRLEIQNSLSTLLLKDGFLYYCGIILPSIPNIIFYALSLSPNSTIVIALLAQDFSILYNGIQWVLINRLVLNLSHEVTRTGESTALDGTKFALAGPAFAVNTGSTGTVDGILGNIGAPVRLRHENNSEFGRDVESSGSYGVHEYSHE